MKRNYIHPALECYSSFYGLEKFKGVPQFSLLFKQCKVHVQYLDNGHAARQSDSPTTEQLGPKQTGFYGYMWLDRQKIRNVDSSAAKK